MQKPYVYNETRPPFTNELRTRRARRKFDDPLPFNRGTACVRVCSGRGGRFPYDACAKSAIISFDFGPLEKNTGQLTLLWKW